MDFDLKGMQESAIFRLEAFKGRRSLPKEWKSLQQNVREICDCFLVLSAASLLVDVKPKMFFTNLGRCVENWKRYLLVSQAHYQIQAPFLYHQPVFAAVILEDKLTCEALLKQFPVAPRDDEYADNFYLVKLFLLLSLQEGKADQEVLQALKSYESNTDDTFTVDLFKALLSIDDATEHDFWVLFETALYDYDSVVNETANNAATSITKFIAHRYLWFKGLAILLIAQMRGFNNPLNDIKYCPDDALCRGMTPYTGDWVLI